MSTVPVHCSTVISLKSSITLVGAVFDMSRRHLIVAHQHIYISEYEGWGANPLTENQGEHYVTEYP